MPPKKLQSGVFSLSSISEKQFLKYVMAQMLQSLRIKVKESKVIGSTMLEL